MAPSRSRTESLRNSAYNANSPSKRHSSTGPPLPRNVRSPSPTFSETTNVSAMNFGIDGPSKIITRTDLKASVQAYERLMDTCANYRSALMTMSQATASFADAMEVCSGLKGPSYETGTRLQAASGLHHLIGNHYHVLAETLDKKFEKPLRQHFDTYRSIMTDRSTSYERALREKSEIIKQTERRNLNRKERNLQSFREALVVLQRQVDDLDELKANHYQEIMEHEEEVWDVVQGKVCLMVRSSLDIFDRFTAKASDPIIEPMLQIVPDPFDSYGPPQSEDQIFSILPPLSIMPTAPSSTASPTTRTPELDAIEGLPSSSSSAGWMHHSDNNTTNNAAVTFPSQSSEWADIPSSPTSQVTSSSPTTPTSPTSRRHSVPRTHSTRKSDSSKVRSVLSVIDESRPSRKSNNNDDKVGQSSFNNTTTTSSYTSGSGSTFTGSTLNGSSSSSSSSSSSLIQQPQPQRTFSWTNPFSYGYSSSSPYDFPVSDNNDENNENENESETPRNSTFFPQGQEEESSLTLSSSSSPKGSRSHTPVGNQVHGEGTISSNDSTTTTTNVNSGPVLITS
ncbi:hypothetical protein K435DRAFT_747984 [Dendrothele bispora CBS 962.96]|uniref:IMD domain-containing protein n=1 Tax=Dendrothele bispora (strain CBS 962.96) TaxID=1314807 RepID=A0A4S8ML31_DENBC|nr:hypothetical protein K435DRAFT_747984 [Dendrothele bispora CBS 962.96]